MELVGMTTSNIDNSKDQVIRGTYNAQDSNATCFIISNLRKKRIV
jgi:hypothetical protein